MERERWPPLYHELRAAARDFRQKYVSHQPWVVAAVLLWAALHDRTITWACQGRHWSTTRLRPARLPSQPTVSRRTRRAAFGLFLNLLTERLRGRGLPGLAVALDGKPLLVGGCRKDPDARFGRAAGHVGRGYKLHAAWGGRPMPEAWEVTPLNGNEKAVGAALAGRLDGGGGYLLADGYYDASYVYDAAAARGYQMVAPCRQCAEPGSGNHYQSPHRLRCLGLLGAPFGAPFARALLAARAAIERSFGNATAFAGGLGPLPAWVRRPWRVEPWVWAKLAINAVRIRQRQPAPA